MNAKLRVGLLSAAYLVVLIGGPPWAMASPLPWAIAIGAGTLAALVALLHLILRTLAPVKRVPAPAAPDPWDAIRDGIRESSTDELIAMWNSSTTYLNAGTAIQLDGVIRPTASAELTARKIPLCRCGAPLAGGIHPTDCQEGR